MSEANRQDCGICLHSPCKCIPEIRELMQREEDYWREAEENDLV